MTVGSRLVGYLFVSQAKFKVNFNDDKTLEIVSSEPNGNLTEDGVYRYVVREGDTVDVYGSYGFMKCNKKMESERKKLEEINYTVSSMRP
jgi:hypothetical protein